MKKRDSAMIRVERSVIKKAKAHCEKEGLFLGRFVEKAILNELKRRGSV